MRYLLFISAALVFLGLMGMGGYLPVTPSKTISGKPASAAVSNAGVQAEPKRSRHVPRSALRTFLGRIRLNATALRAAFQAGDLVARRKRLPGLAQQLVDRRH